ncbi:DUF1015 family protein [Zooshikella harenae]|uniref:DUF1015 family protein n=1 Tax=Zooshikella harenae TaxID=2827238 RepID=A0ABS5ZBP9_9GAMM|nr:DUF1015 family protein [Zooshikella harenae]MBU2711482.1 DUF1015 family protein [Zooshikella harenae]
MLLHQAYQQRNISAKTVLHNNFTMSHLLLYRISGHIKNNYHSSIGISCYYNQSHSHVRSKIVPHEKIDEYHVKEIERTMIYEPINSPCYLVTQSKLFLFNRLSAWFKQYSPTYSVSINGLTHSFIKINNTEYTRQLMSCLNSIEHFMIADGHHRFAAQKQLFHDQGVSPSLPVFITHTTQAVVKSFDLVASMNQQLCWFAFLHHLKKSGLVSCAQTHEDYHILFNGLHASFRINNYENGKQFSDSCLQYMHILNALKTYKGLDGITSEDLIENNVPHNNMNPTNQLRIKIKPPSVSAMYNTALNGSLLPKKSTCFLFKPVEHVTPFLATPGE